MDNPVQHLTFISVPGRASLNADYPDGVANYWTGTVVTDPSTNNQPLGRPIRNMLNSEDPMGTPVPRVVRVGGSGRPQIREFTQDVTECVCRTYHLEGPSEFLQDFTICGDETFPLDFTERAWPDRDEPGFLTAPGPNVPTVAEVNDIYGTATSDIGAGPTTPYATFDDAPCGE